ncbi:methyltransferase [Breoghania sp.]|uniref:methyltransferase n=1 Tax=Breoghania sp. TaxID=2065378 RepID=UPI002612C560|nr:methyltransferase [Breoghania sp.]MDJ0931578.1 methyltransferase [Breoghania sp.]
MTSPKSLETAEQISDIAFAFMGSKALFTALHVGLCTALADEGATLDAVAGKTDLDPDRATTLLTALTTLGLVEREGDVYRNSPAAEAFLVNGRKYDFGDYLRLQIDKQMYPFLAQLEGALTGELNPEQVSSYADWFSDPKEARLYSESQHAGSLGPGRSLARTVDLSAARKMLDVGGGTGTFSISLCKAYPELTSTVLDFPNVVKVGEVFVKQAGLSDRVKFQGGNALESEWPTPVDVVLMSYLFSGVPGESIPGLVRGAMDALMPGRHFIVHDFMVEDERMGPKLAALWQLQHVAFNPKAKSITGGYVRALMEAAGFVDVEVSEMIPGMTMMVRGVKPKA